ncbi:MAG TPA: ester cyclase [Anaerolineaceae bacterium]|jgi:steroid delta-isomerase-like uncharacterized protein
MNIDQNKELLRRFSAEILNQGNMVVADQIIAPDYLNHNPVPGQAPGLEGFKRSITSMRMAFPDLNETIEAIIAEGDLVSVRATHRGTHEGTYMGVPGTNRSVIIPTMYFVRVVNGKITDLWLNWDILGMLQQIGAFD